MSEMALVDAPVRFPTACVCGNQTGRMVDTHIENAVGHVYLCERCVKAAALEMGFVPRDILDMKQTVIDGFEARVDELEELLAYERAHKLVDAQEFAELLLSRAKEAASS